MDEAYSGITLEDQENTSAASENDDDDFQMVSLPMNEELMPEDTYPITASEESKFFVIIGGTGSGKTTLITSMYHLYFISELK